MNIFYLKLVERKRERGRKRDRALLEKGMAWVINLTIGQVINEG
jgi:hypothetical protein